MSRVRHGIALCVVVAAACFIATAPAEAGVYVGPYGAGGTLNVYETVDTPATWADAQAIAQSRTDPLFGTGVTGNLVAINSQAENDFIHSISGGEGTWIGATDETVEGEWRWVNDGTQFWQGGSAAEGGYPVAGSYVNWQPDEPNDLAQYGPAGEDYGFMDYGGDIGWWFDFWGDTEPWPYVIEYETERDTAIPEPATLSLLGFAAVVLLRRRGTKR